MKKRSDESCLKCGASRTITMVYADGGMEVVCGLLEGSAPCECSRGHYYVSPDGELYDSVWEWMKK